MAEKRRVWIEQRQPLMRLAPQRLVFIDETAVATNLTRLRGRAPCGERLKGEAPFGRWTTQTFIAGLRCNRLMAPWIIDGPIDRIAFDTYIETQLASIPGARIDTSALRCTKCSQPRLPSFRRNQSTDPNLRAWIRRD